MKILLALFAFALPALAQSGTTQITGSTATNVAVVTPVLSGVSETSSASTIAVKFTSSSFATPGFACGTVAGTYNITAVDNGIDVLSPLLHVQIVEGLSPSTTYYCQYTATNSAGSASGTFSLATTAAAVSTPITGASFSAPASMASQGSCTGVADTFANAVSNDGYSYFTNDDTSGWACGGVPASSSADLSVGRWTSLSPLEGYTVNFLSAFGGAGAASAYDGASSKADSLFAMAGYLFLWGSGQFGGDRAAYTETGGNLMMSPDHGLSWSNFQGVGNFQANGKATTAAMFPSGGPMGTLGSCRFVMYGPDDGTVGYFQTVNQHDNADAFVYLVCNDGYWNNGNAYYLVRVPRAKLAHQNPADYQVYTGGDGSLDAAWSSTFTSATAILSNTGELGWPAPQYIPALNRYVMPTFYYPQGLTVASGNKSNTTWLVYEAQHPWGPWTLINTTTWPTQGYYDAVPIVSTAQSGTTPTVVFTGSFCCTPSYVPYTATMTLTH